MSAFLGNAPLRRAGRRPVVASSPELAAGAVPEGLTRGWFIVCLSVGGMVGLFADWLAWRALTAPFRS